jgi:CubicO group peptidase (beta-lactamase class C family)
MNRVVSFLLLSLALFYPVTTYGQTATSSPSRDEALTAVQIWLDAQKDYERLPAISAAIVHDQELVWSGAVGMADVGAGRPATAKTLYSICSISKLFTSVATMQLRDQGKLRLADPVGKHLSFFSIQQKFEDSTPVTIESLLTHSGGMPREADYPYWSGPDFEFPTKEEVIARLSGQETIYSSQTTYQYSNLGMSLLGYLIEEVSGQPYEEYVRQNILGPLEMSDTYTEMPAQHVGGQLAKGYGGITRQGDRDEVTFFTANGIAPAAGYASTVEDLAKFAMWQFRLRGDQEEVLHGYTLAEMQRVHFATPGSTTMRGLGFSLSERDGKTFVGHGGSCPGFRTQLSMQNKDRIAVVSMVNATENAGKYLNGIYDLIAPALIAEAKKGEEDEPQTEAAEIDYAKYVGTYTGGLGGNETVVIPWKGGIGTMSLPSDNPSVSVLIHVEGDTFRREIQEGRPVSEVIFDTDEEGRVTRMRTPVNFRIRVGPLPVQPAGAF